MNSLLMIIGCLVLIGTVWTKEGYLVNMKTGCKYGCYELGDNGYCDRKCKAESGNYGYCYTVGCWCEGLPNSKPTWPLPGKSCSGK
uniref:Toxin Cll6 n=1 Tax=Centruroides limpidus TaxID=6876 RepID=SCX6_CENLI|nr:RecName: Full=Toxin Cll6; Flags: Precursor [Centruroides limpidus]AAP49507.1 sodium-channel modifier toxin Cll6 precursor [Centruroides limpidus limpidus]